MAEQLFQLSYCWWKVASLVYVGMKITILEMRMKRRVRLMKQFRKQLKEGPRVQLAWI